MASKKGSGQTTAVTELSNHKHRANMLYMLYASNLLSAWGDRYQSFQPSNLVNHANLPLSSQDVGVYGTHRFDVHLHRFHLASIRVFVFLPPCCCCI